MYRNEQALSNYSTSRGGGLNSSYCISVQGRHVSPYRYSKSDEWYLIHIRIYIHTSEDNESQTRSTMNFVKTWVSCSLFISTHHLNFQEIILDPYLEDYSLLSLIILKIVKVQVVSFFSFFFFFLIYFIFHV